MKRVCLVLVLSVAVTCLAASVVQASQKSIEPDTVWLSLAPGQSAQIEKTVIVPPIIPKGDVMFSFDLTGSMSGEIATAKTEAVNIMNIVSGLITDVQFGVISYMDYNGSYDTCDYSASYGSGPDYPYNLDQALTPNTALVNTAIQGLSLGYGDDGPQDYTRIFYESYADAGIGYRPGAKKMLLNFADNVPHDCNLNEDVPGQTGVWSTGADPGRDAIMTTSDDLDLQTVLGEMASAGRTLLEIHTSSYAQAHWEYWTSSTGGALFLLSGASQIPAAVESLILEQALYIDSLTLKVTTPGFESWLTSLVPPYYLDIEAPDTLDFTEEITVPEDTPCGTTYVFQISAIGDGASYGDQIVIVEVPCAQIVIPNTDECVNPGEYVCLPILLDNNATPFGGFELEVEFDYTSMTFVSAEKGEAIEGFEYFTYRLLPCPRCPCCKYKILLYGQYDLPNGVENVGSPIPVTPAGFYQVLVDLCFVVNNDENLRGFKIPVCFEWEGTVVNDTLVEDWECSENTFSSWSGDTLFTSSLLCQFNPDICDDPGDRIQPVLIFQDGICGQNCGGVDICPAGPGECKRGDVNYNTITYEVADAVLFASYFVEGLPVFRYFVPYQVCATDVNADGRTLTLSDLVYLIRVILHDAVEIPKVAPSSDVASLIVSDGMVRAECASPIGALLFEFDGAVEPILLAENMEMLNRDNKVLVWSREGNSIENAQVISFAGAQLVSVAAVDRDSRELTTSIVGRVAPVAFALHAAYPNPFNPFTNMSFSLPEAASYSLNIYNVAGQLVRSYQGVGAAGLNVITWDGNDNAGSEVSSGVYFQKLTAAGNSATAKMVMMK